MPIQYVSVTSDSNGKVTSMYLSVSEPDDVYNEYLAVMNRIDKENGIDPTEDARALRSYHRLLSLFEEHYSQDPSVDK